MAECEKYSGAITARLYPSSWRRESRLPALAAVCSRAVPVLLPVRGAVVADAARGLPSTSERCVAMRAERCQRCELSELLCVLTG